MVRPTWRQRGAPGCSKCRFRGCKICFHGPPVDSHAVADETADDTTAPAPVSSSNTTATNEHDALIEPPVSRIKIEAQVPVKDEDGGEDTKPAAGGAEGRVDETEVTVPVTVSSSNITTVNEQNDLEPPVSRIKIEAQVPVKAEDEEDTKPAAVKSAGSEDIDATKDQKPAAAVSSETSNNTAGHSGEPKSEQRPVTVPSSAVTNSTSQQASNEAASMTMTPGSQPAMKKRRIGKDEQQSVEKSKLQIVGNLNLPETARNSGLEGIRIFIHDDQLPAKFPDVLKLMDFFFEGGSYFQVLWLDASRPNRLGYHTRRKLRKLEKDHPGVAWHQHKEEWAPRCKQDLLSFIPVLQSLYEG